MDDPVKEVELLVSARTPLLLIETAEHARVDDLFRRVATRTGKPAWRWSMAGGLERLDNSDQVLRSLNDPQKFLQHVLAATPGSLFVMHDRVDPSNAAFLVMVSLLREIGDRYDKLGHTVAIVGPEFSLPADLRPLAAKVELPMPTPEEVSAIINEEAEAWGKRQQRRVQASAAAISALQQNLLGLGPSDVRRLVRAALHDGTINDADIPAVQEAKYKLLDQGGVLSFEFNRVKLDDVAGLANMKRWLETRRSVFLSSVAPAGLDPPKGLLLLGVQGGGKSLAAKAVAGAWDLPLIRLDFAALYNKYYGETERNLRDALKTASVMAPVCLWIDEIEKGLASEGDDGGPGRRILGTLLTWMAERKDKVFLVATANDIESLPPELLRKGRFDEIFFVDLPKQESREVIFNIHLKKRGQQVASFDLPTLAAACDGFSGAEIEQAVVAALYGSHAKAESMTTEHVLTELKATRPLSVVMAERMAYLRAWASSRTVSAD